MKSYYLTKHFMILLVLLYFIIGMGLELGHRFFPAVPTEIFPIFSWRLFAVTPSEVDDYTLRIISYNGRKLEEPIFFEEGEPLFQKKTTAIAYNNLQGLGKATAEGDLETSAEKLQLLRSIYPGIIENMNFEIVKRTYNPLDRLKYDTYKKIEVVGYVENDDGAK
jgi:hypothetical protein